MARIAIIGPAYPLRGGLATFNQRLAEQFIREGDECDLWSFSLQYPSFLFPGKTQYSTDPAPEGLNIHTRINSVNPLNWITTGNRIRKKNYDIVIVRYWLPFMGPALGTILRKVKKNKITKVICIADNVIPHEKRFGDKPFTQYFVKAVDKFITMSEKVMTDLRKFTDKPAQLVSHPLYDNFGDIISKKEARDHLGIHENDRIILFFGFIRKYKGLDILLNAMKDERIRSQNIKLLVSGEFYEDARQYESLINSGIRDLLILRTDFIPDSEVKYHLCSADAVIQPYRNATQSGVTPLAYHFEKPMIVTNVGGLPALVPHEKSGLVAEPEPASIADAIIRFYQLGENYFIHHLREEKKKYSWATLVSAIRSLASNEPGSKIS